MSMLLVREPHERGLALEEAPLIRRQSPIEDDELVRVAREA